MKKNPLPLLAAAILVGLAAALVGYLRLAAVILADAPVRIWPPDRPEVVANLAFTAVSALLLLASFVLLLLGLSRLLRATHPAVRAWLRVPWVFLSALTGLWPLAVLLPAALRLRTRLAAFFAACASILVVLDIAAPFTFRPPAAPSFLLSAETALFLFAALLGLARRLDVPWRPMRNLLLVVAVLVAVDFFLTPFLRIRPGNRTDALIARILDRCKSPLRPGAPIPWARPPVAPEDDPIAALSPDALKEDAFIARELERILSQTDPRPLAQPQIDLLAAWLDSHPALETAADALSSPSYRSSLPGLAITDGFASPYDNLDANWTEPRLAPGGIGRACFLFLCLRARLAAALDPNLDAPESVVFDHAALHHLAIAAAQTPTLIGLLYARTYLSVPTDLAHWPDDALSALVAEAQSLADWADAHWADWFVGEILFCNAHLHDEPTALLSLLPRWRRLVYAAARPRWAVAASWNACLRDLLDMTTPDGLLPAPRAPAWDQFDSLYHFPTHLARFRLHADFLSAAVAVERHRRATGALPPTLDALVPDYLPAVPRSPYDNAPLDYSPAPKTFRRPQTVTLPTLDDIRLDYRKTRAPLPPLDTPLDGETLRALTDAYASPPPSGPTLTLDPATIPGYTLTLPSPSGLHPTPHFFPVPAP